MVTRDDLNAYLLHQMPETQRSAFAEQWFADADLYQQLTDAETDLLDAYVRGAVSRRQRGQIEHYLLDSEVQRQKLAFAAALHALLPRPVRRSMSWLGICAAAVIVLLAGLSIWAVLQNSQLKSQLAILRGSAPSGVYSAWLPAGTLRGSTTAASVRIPSGATLLQLELELEGAEVTDIYAGELSIGGRAIWKEAPLQAEHRGKVFLTTMWIPASVLVPGNYILALQKNGFVAYYELVIAR
jgi:hypothetical protein